MITRFVRSLGGVRRQPFQRRPELEALEDRMVPSTTGLSVIPSHFNSTAIGQGDTIWFSSVAKVSGVKSSPVTIYMVNASLDFTANGTAYHESLPNAALTFSPTATTASTTFNVSANTWDTTVPSHPGGNVFLDGFALPVPGGLPGGIHPVTFQATFETTATGLSVEWKWSAAVYSLFSTDYNALNVKPVDSKQLSAYKNSDHAGTPEAFKKDVLGGARGHGRSNFTGSYSATAKVVPGAAASANLSGNAVDVSDNLGVSGAVITLTGTDLNGNAVNLTATTGTNGKYTFGNLVAGNYTLTVTPADGYHASGALVGTDNGVTNGSANSSGTQISGIALNPGDSGTGYGFVLSSSIVLV